VLDGHGETGHLIASFVQDKLVKNLAAQSSLLVTNTKKAIVNAVKRTCDELASTDINLAYSGTTAVFGVQVGDMLYTANVGDSRCVLCKKITYSSETNNPKLPLFQAIPLSIDQKPERPDEKARIVAAGGRVAPMKGEEHLANATKRVWLAQLDTPGLAMSRSIGDEVSQTVGVTSDPEIVEHKLDTEDIFVIWATDGLWEFMSEQKVCQSVWNNRADYQHAAEAVALQARQLWKDQDEGPAIDDISVVIVGFNHPERV